MDELDREMRQVGTDAGGLAIDEISDEELTALALAASPDQPIDDDAVPLAIYPVPDSGGLPLWYMPPVVARGTRRWRIPVVVAVVVALLLPAALGLCVTYGVLTVA